MTCRYPRTVAFADDGKTIIWSRKKQSSKELVPFQLPCGKCTECRLEYARQWAIRCVHESKMHEKNTFITLTYSDEHLTSPKLQYSDFQNFMKKLRKLSRSPIGVFVTGEYGEKTKRPHWHAIIFGWEPPDLKKFRRNERGDQIFKSQTLDRVWALGNTECGSVTFESAGYCARYAAKKLVHGKDQDHEYHPISKKSSKHAIGKKWLEKYWRDAFENGEIIILDNQGSYKSCSIPRYYEKWLQKHEPEAWLRYVTTVKSNKKDLAQQRADKEQNEWIESIDNRPHYKRTPLSKRQVKAKITDQKFEQLQKHLKL